MLEISYVSATVCTSLPKNLTRGQESSAVLSLQNFLFEKSFLKALPNGYFGLGTFTAVAMYQKNSGLPQVGNVGKATRASIKKETCIESNVGTSTPTATLAGTSTHPVAPIAVIVIPKTQSALRNEKRRADLEILLKALYRYFVDSRGVHSALVGDIPHELCVNPINRISTVASTTEVAVVVTPVLPCDTFINISYLSPSYITSIPRDPQLATSSVFTGYTITRSENNDIVLAAKSPEDGASIRVTCNFNGYCKDIEDITKVTYKKPSIISLNRNFFLRDTSPRVPFIIKGDNFAATNTVKLLSLYSGREFILGDFTSTSYSTSTAGISIEGGFFNQLFPCGGGCVQKLPLGEYDVVVSNKGGISNPGHIMIKGFTTSTISTQVNSSIIPTTRNIKVGTITLSSSAPVSLISLTLTSTSSSKNLPSKISNFILKDQSDGTTYGGGGAGVFTLSGVSMYENQSRVYDIYIDTSEVYSEDTGFITYGGKFLAHDAFTDLDMELPIKEFSFTVSR